ncbi:MAG: ribosomal-protein-alanine N-acetyltransferase [Gemmatimonadetes bacterium]|nr:ribosomal-protein-alanine N-acetyltransferase [Gemmatimonadota bacterium]
MTAAAVRVRAATADDLDAVARIEFASFADPWSRAAFLECLVGGTSQLMVAAPPSASPVGYVVVRVAADEAEIANLAVAASARRTGIGATLLDAALASARARRCAAVFLEVRESNRAARMLYAARGFREVGRRTGYYRHPDEDALILRADLTDALR